MKTSISKFLPLSMEEARERGWDYVDIVLVTGDAYVDHPSFGAAMIGRILESCGYKVGIIPMPDRRNPESVTEFGKPRLFFGVTSGAVDSMIANYTAFKRKRNDDAYAPGGKAGHRPDRALIVYCNMIKAKFRDVPVVIGGIEASMRRMAHYDFWDNKVRRSMMEDSRADILAFGMAENQVTEIAARIAEKKPLEGIPGTVIISKEKPENAVLLPDENSVISDQPSFIKANRIFYCNQHKILCQKTGTRYIIQYPAKSTDSTELDSFYSLPFSREPHPSYKEKIPAFEMIKNSATSHRGCFSGCSFCSLSLHQGKRIISRSEESVIDEVKILSGKKYFKGHVNDVGGPSANMYGFGCAINWQCGRNSCIFPSLCANLQFNTVKWIDLLKKISRISKVRKTTIGSGIRYDLFMKDPEGKKLLRELLKNHVSGQLKIAPEHTSERVLNAMGKKPLFPLVEFIKFFRRANSELNKKQYLVPYLMSCHPGSDDKDMNQLKKDIKNIFGFIPDQVQAFIPLPMTISSVIYYTGVDPLTGKKYKVIQDMNGRRKQHNILLNK